MARTMPSGDGATVRIWKVQYSITSVGYTNNGQDTEGSRRWCKAFARVRLEMGQLHRSGPLAFFGSARHANHAHATAHFMPEEEDSPPLLSTAEERAGVAATGESALQY